MKHLKTGLCSITFRQLDVGRIVELVDQAGLDAIEWGGDVHVPHGDTAAAGHALKATGDAGLVVSSYGSYCFVLDEQGREEEFEPVLESALALGTDTVRIWAGRKGSDIANEGYRRRVVEQSVQIADQAASQGVRIAFEFHRNTLNDTNESALRLLQECNHPNLYTYWQPIYWISDMEYRLQGLETLKDRVLNLHVFRITYNKLEQGDESIEWNPLADGKENWERYLLVSLLLRERYALLEFVKDNDPEQFLRDAATLKQFVAHPGRAN